MNKLDQAKLNLKSVLKRLEEVVEKELSSNSAGSDGLTQEEILKLQKNLSESEKKVKNNEEEILYLRETNHKLQAKLGDKEKKLDNIEAAKSNAADKVDSIIKRIRGLVDDKDAA
jgi:predicted  nucleic acid-binding Zn-ribbon protein